jgi:hypothetical protein
MRNHLIPTASEEQATSFCFFTRTATVFHKELVKDTEKQMGIIVLLR